MSGDNKEDYYNALRSLAICKHYRRTLGDGVAASGGNCDLCNEEWNEGEPEKHAPDCLAAPGRM